MDHSYHQKLYILKCRFDFQVSNSSREMCQLSSTINKSNGPFVFKFGHSLARPRTPLIAHSKNVSVTAL